MLTAATGILTNEVNVGFTPEGKYLTAGNDVVDLSKWDGIKSVNIGDAFSGDNDKVTVMADKLALTSPVANPKLKLTSIENLEIINSGEKKSVILDGANFKGLEAIKLIGDATTLSVSNFTQGVKIDATANADYIIGSSKADTINGGAGNDTIVGNGGNDVLTGGNGADTFVVGSIKDAGVDQILDFSAEDKISLGGGAYTVKELKKFDASTFSTVTYKTLDSVLATFATGGANATKNGDVVIFSYDGKTYALLANGAFDEKTDALVDITGANVASLTESNFGEAVSLYTYENYAAFKDNANNIPAGEAIIKTMTVENAQALAVDNNLLAKVANGGIKAITGITDSITVNMPNKAGASEFNASVFESKLSQNVDLTDIVMNINGTDTNDTIIASKFGGTITAKGGNDDISLGAGADTVVFADSASNNGVDTISGFTAGASNGDVLAISGLLGAQFNSSNFVASTNGTGSGDLTSSKQVLIHAGSAAIDAANASTNFSTSDDASHYKIGSSQKLFVVDTKDDANILYLVDGNSGSITIDKVGTLNAGSSIASSLTADNFGNVA